MSSAIDWLEPLRSSFGDLGQSSWQELRRLNTDLKALCVNAPHAASPARWSHWLLEVRHDLAVRGHYTPPSPAGAVWQTLAQFVAGFHDLDLRDSVGLGHGAMILTAGYGPTAQHWAKRLAAGELVGIAATERHGGSRIQEITTRAVPDSTGCWLINGEKCWISRLAESTGFVVFFRDPDSRISAAIVEASDPGLDREVVEPFGLGGWSWGMLRLNEVRINPVTDMIGRAGGGLTLFRRHFSSFRPLVTAAALGAAAGVHAVVADGLVGKTRTGILSRVRDNALITLGRTYAQLTAALLSAVATSRLAHVGHPHADFAARIGKAAGVDIAFQVVGELAPLLGAAGFQRAHPIAKAKADLTGLLYADGIHDSLYRSGGVTLLADSHRNRCSTIVS